MRRYVNRDTHARVWVSLSGPDGRTLRLAPGESVDLDLPDDFSDPHLALVKKPAKPAKPAEE